MKKLKLLCFSGLIVALLGLIPGGAAIAFEGDDGGFDGGFDGGGDDAGDEAADSDGAEDNDDQQDDHQAEDRDKDRRTDEHGHHHGYRHHGGSGHTHIINGWPGFGFGPAFGFGAFGYTPPRYYGYSPGGFQPTQPDVVYIEKKRGQFSSGFHIANKSLVLLPGSGRLLSRGEGMPRGLGASPGAARIK